MKTSYDPDERWREIKEMPEHRFESRLARDVINWSGAWDLPEPYVCVVRVDDLDAGLVREKAFKKVELAQKYVERLEQKGVSYAVYNAEEMYSNMEMRNYDEAESSD